MSRNNQIQKNAICITEAQLLLYTQGTLPIGEQKSIESHLVQCDMCNDAIEGLRLIKNKDLTIELIASLRKKINKDLYLSANSKKIISPVWQFAAIFVILLLSAGGYMVIHYTVKNIENKFSNLPFDQNLKDKSRIDQKVVSENEKLLTTSQRKQIAEPAKANVARRASNNNILIQQSEIPNNKKSKVVLKDDVKSMNILDKNLPSSFPEAYQNINNQQKRMISTESIVVKKNSENYLKGKQWLDEQKFDLALPFFLKSDNSFESFYFAGMCYYHLEQYDSSIVKFDQCLKEVSTIYFEDALWYKANSLIKLNERKSAKAILKKIISLKGKYQNSANKLLTTL